VGNGCRRLLLGDFTVAKGDKTYLDRLRKQAEERLNKAAKVKQNLSVEDVKELVHELAVYQAELEIQNEELRRAQLELEQSRQDYIELFDNAPVGYLILDKSGLIKKANLTAARFLNSEKINAEGKPFKLFLSEFFRDGFSGHLEKVRTARSQQTCVTELRRTSSRSIWAKLYTIPIMDSAGKITGFRLVILDVTDLNQFSREK
jgi:PAS domain S-box-containing protein